MLRTLNTLRKKREDQGFTLIELLVVILIIGILAAIVVVAVRGTTGDASVNACNQSAVNLSNALDRYIAANGDVIPTATGAAPTNITNPLGAGITLINSYTKTELEGLLVPNYIKSVPDPAAAENAVIAVTATKGGTDFVGVLCQAKDGKNAGL